MRSYIFRDIYMKKQPQAKMIASFPFQDFQNIMRAEGHYSLFIMAKTLKKTLKLTITIL